MNLLILDIIEILLFMDMREEGTITTPFDMRVLNEIDRYHLVMEAIRHLDLGVEGKHVMLEMERLLKKHHNYIREHGVDMPEITEWKWQ